MELAVVNCDCRFALGLFCRLPLKDKYDPIGQRGGVLLDKTRFYSVVRGHLAVHHDLVIDSKLALRHSRQIGLHQDLKHEI